MAHKFLDLLSMYILETRPCYNNMFVAGVKCRRRRFFFINVKKKCFVQRFSIKSNLSIYTFVACVIIRSPEDDRQQWRGKQEFMPAAGEGSVRSQGGDRLA